jgi:hypothetical protein
MYKILKITLILLLFQGYIFAQNNTSDYWQFAQNDTSDYRYQSAIKVFDNKYEKQHYERFTRKIEVLDSNIFIFRDKFRRINTIEVRRTKNELNKIFTEGILYPEIIIGQKNYKNKKIRKRSDNADIRLYYIQELEKINPDFQTKRFFFSRNVAGHPQRCYIELYNPNATENMAIEEFIKGANLTFYYKVPFK